MSDNRFDENIEDDDELLIDFIDAEDDEEDDSIESEDDMEEDDDGFRVNYDYDEFIAEEGKLTTEEKLNRVMIGLGAVIFCFTVFYSAVLGKHFFGNKEPAATEPVTTVSVEEETSQPVEEGMFVSPYKDDNISEDIKSLLNDVDLKPKSTGFSKVDNKLNDILKSTCTDEMTNYEKVRNIYDYMLVTYTTKKSSFVDSDSIYDFCSSVNYVSEFDREMLYRTNKLISDGKGSSDDYACEFTLLLRKLGLEAYYIKGEIETEDENGYDTYGDSTITQERGYTIVIINDKKYIFDVEAEDELIEAEEEAAEEEELTASGYDYDETTDEVVEDSTEETSEDVEEPENKSDILLYGTFCRTFSELTAYSDNGVEDSIDAFCEFETLADMSFKASVSASNGEATSGSVGYVEGYSESGNTTVLDEISIDINDTVYLSGSVSGSVSNTWKLLVRVYDKDMNYITESTVYNVSNSSSSNEVSYSPSRGGYMKLLYMVTDENGRTCTISVLVEVTGYEEETTTVEETTTTTGETETQEPETEKSNPVITLKSLEGTIYEGDKFEYMNYVKSAVDGDTDLSTRVIVDGDYDVNKPGDYKLTYSVKAVDGTLSEKVNFTLHVLPKEPPKETETTPEETETSGQEETE